ncbi:MAG: hypothetical protein LW847_10395 [Burkholderiales bacterium]|jgi:hypothetical protein|nr:hypothetical protein [Burkholderiales bacterium]
METRFPHELRGSGLFIGANGCPVAATTPDVRLRRMSERGAERSERGPLTLMNSARRAACRGARKENAGAKPALKVGAQKAAEDFWREPIPQDSGVLMSIRPMGLTMERKL